MLYETTTNRPADQSAPALNPSQPRPHGPRRPANKALRLGAGCQLATTAPLSTAHQALFDHQQGTPVPAPAPSPVLRPLAA